MALTRDFKETIKDRVERDPVFREERLKEGIEYLVTKGILFLSGRCRGARYKVPKKRLINGSNGS